MASNHPLRTTIGGSGSRPGFTLLEVMIATVVTLIMTALVAQMFQFVSDGIFNSRAMIEISDQLRNARNQLVQDLRGATAPTVPPLDPSQHLGYFEYAEGPIVANSIGGNVGLLTSLTTSAGLITPTITSAGQMTMVNTVPGDIDDILMFTTYALGDQFVGKAGSGTITTPTSARAAKSRFAEVAWHTRGIPAMYTVATGSALGTVLNNLYRRVWLINGASSWGSAYQDADQSMREEFGAYEDLAGPRMTTSASVATLNSLGDLTMRERRSVHQPYVWPFEMLYARGPAGSAQIMSVVSLTWNTVTSTTTTLNQRSWGSLVPFGLPTLRDQTTSAFPDPIAPSVPPTASRVSFALSNNGVREAEDVICTGVVSFDVKAWDPGAPVFRVPLANQATLTSNVVDPNMVGLVMPGDPGYGGDGRSHPYITGGNKTFPIGALYRFVNSPNTAANQPVAFGAFADLNYMWLCGCSGTDNVISTTSALNRYLTALRTYEEGVLRRNETPVMVKLPRPSFGFANRGRILSGYPPDAYPIWSSSYTPTAFPAVWDSWSRHYEYDGIDNDGDGVIDEASDGIDNNGNGFIDELPVPIDSNSDGYIDTNEMYNAELNSERDAPPPYDAPLRGIKVTIRIMEEDSKQVREVSTVHEFIPF